MIVYDKDLLNADRGKYIIKMHGDLSDASSIVLKEQDYDYRLLGKQAVAVG